VAFAGAVLAGGLSAACLAFALYHGETLYVLLACLTAIPLYMIGLGGGSLAGLVAGVTGCACLLLVLPSNFAFIYAFLFAIPAAGASALALRRGVVGADTINWFPEGFLLSAIVLYPCVIFFLIGAATMHIDGGFLGLTSRMLHDHFVDAIMKNRPELAPQAETLFNGMIKFLPSIVGCVFILLTVISVFVGQTMLVQQKWNLRPSFRINDMYVPRWLVIVLALAVLTGVVAAAPYDYIGANLGMMLSIPFFFTGLSVVHSLAPLTGWPIVTLVVFYILLMAVIWLSLLVMLVGISDQWIHFRQRFAARLNTVNASI
jgi:hypothetical protein